MDCEKKIYILWTLKIEANTCKWLLLYLNWKESSCSSQLITSKPPANAGRVSSSSFFSVSDTSNGFWSDMAWLSWVSHERRHSGGKLMIYCSRQQFGRESLWTFSGSGGRVTRLQVWSCGSQSISSSWSQCDAKLPRRSRIISMNWWCHQSQLMIFKKLVYLFTNS